MTARVVTFYDRQRSQPREYNSSANDKSFVTHQRTDVTVDSLICRTFFSYSLAPSLGAEGDFDGALELPPRQPEELLNPEWSLCGSSPRRPGNFVKRHEEPSPARLIRFPLISTGLFARQGTKVTGIGFRGRMADQCETSDCFQQRWMVGNCGISCAYTTSLCVLLSEQACRTCPGIIVCWTFN